jgi:hypothetical protein
MLESVTHLRDEQVSPNTQPWMTTENDLPWLIYLGKKRYGTNFDYTTVEGWYRNIVLKSPLMFHCARMPNAFCISMISTVPWAPSEFEVNVIFICAEEGAMWEAMRLLRDSVAWAKTRKCCRWRVSSNTEYDVCAMAKRLGATEITPRFSMEL